MSGKLQESEHINSHVPWLWL